MRAETLSSGLAGVAVCLVLAQAASATPLAGLTESVSHGITATDYAPASVGASDEELKLQAVSPAYTFANRVDGFSHAGGSMIGADATGTLAASDTTGLTSFDPYGDRNVAKAGNNTSNLGNAYEAVDDAAQFTDISVVAPQNFQAGLGKDVTTMYLKAGYTANLFSFQQGGDYHLASAITGPSGAPAQFAQSAVSVPEPGTLASFVLALGVVGLAFVRQFASFALPKQDQTSPG